MDKKFVINGRETAYYYLTNQELIDLLNDSNTSKEDKEFLTQQIITRFKYECCPRDKDEDNHDVFARQFENFVNGKCYDMKKTANIMSKKHRYLVQEMFKLFIEFVRKLSQDYDNKRYDGRNEWSAQMSKEIVEHFDYLRIGLND